MAAGNKGKYDKVLAIRDKTVINTRLISAYTNMALLNKGKLLSSMFKYRQDGGTDGFALMDYMYGYEKVLIVDAVNMNVLPGEIRLFSPQEAILSITSDALSTHGFGVAEVIALMEKMDMQVNLQILGIQAKDVTFGEGLSPEIAARIDDVIELVKKVVS